MDKTLNQKNAFDKFAKLKVGALFMKMGTGKTRVALDLVNYNNVDLLIYVCPFSTKNNIKNEIEKWGVNCKYVLVGYETLQASDRIYLDLLMETEGKKCFIIADESIFIKNEETKRFNRLINLRYQCEYALILNGTPITKNEWDLYNQMYFLSPLIINMNRQEFLNSFFRKITYKRKHEKEKSFYQFSEVNAEFLKKMIAPYMFECDLDFDKKINQEIRFIKCEKKEYQKEKEDKLKEYLRLGNSETIINLLQNLNRISANSKEKNDALIDYIKGKKVIVYCNYLSEVDYIKNKINCYVITGETNNRKSIIENFKNDNKPLIMTYGVGSYSQNLQFCNEIVYSSLTFDYGKFEQSKYRIKRMGQEDDIYYTYILSDFGINRMIIENLDKKRFLENLIKQKIMDGDLEWLKNI